MAEFKLGRIRFVWKNDWTTTTVYYKDDVVAYGGKMYICTIGHSSANDFFIDLDVTPSKWNLVSDGQTYKGEWATNTYYVYDDIVKYGARLYICNTVHTSAETANDGLEDDLSKWSVYAEGLDWKGEWTTSTRYRVNDLVKYGGVTYVCNALHTSAATADSGLEANSANWDTFNAGIEYKNAWSNPTRYKLNDVVNYGASLYICSTAHTSTDSFGADAANWTSFVQGFQFEDIWIPEKIYQQGDVVRSGGNQYIANTVNENTDPQTDDGTNWSLFTQGIKFLGEYNDDSSAVEYDAGETVSRGGYLYVAKQKGSGNDPTDTDYWSQLATGLKWTGIWLDDREYVLGDVVRYGNNSYVCINGHISEGDDFSTETAIQPGGGAENSRPDQDTSGTYWNVLAIGTETSVLNTDGDLVYYSGSGPTRLPIGKEGQLLRVSNSNLPEWTYYGVADDVYYVAEHGTDGPTPLHGRTLDKPFKSIRFACEQIEKGAKNPDARRLLELNKYFIQREIVEWTDWQIANAGVGELFNGFTYAESKCERDMGYIVDAVIWDITHGGNVESRKVALEYVNNAPAFYTLGQEAETVASINYGLQVIQRVLQNIAPDVNYQVANGDNSTAVVEQFIDETLVAEPVLPEITNLVGIVTDAITAGNADSLPARLIRNTLIKVSTGRYYEMLPIIVPAECCVIGDELRSTNVQPRKASNTTLTPIFDSNYSFRAIQRIEDIMSDIVQGIAVTPTTGNTTAQSREYPFGIDVQGTGATQAVRTIKKDIDFRLGTKIEAVLPLPSGFDSEYGYARDLIKANKEFINAEVLAYITNNYPAVKYSKTKCKQDVGYILDALTYDLTYGGDWQSVTAGSAYYSGTGGALQIDSEEKTATLAAYGYLKDILVPISRSIAVSPTEQSATTQNTGVGGSVAAGTSIETLMDVITGIIDTGTIPSINYPDITGASAGLQSDHAAIINAGNLTTVKSNVITFITTNFPNLTYNQAKCERDIQLIAYAAAYDAALGSNMASIIAGISYKRTASAKVYGDQAEATLAANLYAAELVKANASEASADAAIDFAYQYANDMIFNATVNQGSNKVTADPNSHFAVRQIELNKDFVKSEVHAYVADYFSGTITETSAIGNTLSIVDTSWLLPGMPLEFINLEDSELAVGNSGLLVNTTYYVANIISSTQFTISDSLNGAVSTISTNAGSFKVEADYTYSQATCSRDVDAYLDAVKDDLLYPANFVRDYTNDIRVVMPNNYKTKLAARYYANSIIGCQEEDFFYLRNGTGLRLMTMDGLQGDLGPLNEYGTRRVTAGAYGSLDPGWGPLHEAVWITARSPYIQNCTTFGYAATGQKIDGALHDGGNDSIVSNDFTQVISDGIGAHILNNGRAELVSVFSYYSHIGYLAESGGRVRATNGNNSYGTFGSVAEGVDAEETPVTAIVDNKFQYNATISDVFCDGDGLIVMEYSHAGNEYTEAELNIFGAGDNEILTFEDTKDFRDDAVFNVRVTQLSDAEEDLAGGSGFTIAQNTAQAGSTTQLTLAQTDGNLSTAYPGMKLIITGGAGVGNFGIIDTYNAGTKVATVLKESDGSAGWDNFQEGKDITAPNASSTYQIEPNVSFSAPPQSATQGAFSSSKNWGQIIHHATTAQYIGIASTTTGDGTLATFDIDKVGAKYYVTVNVSGSGYSRLDTLTIAGTSVGGATPANDITLTLTSVGASGEVVEFDYEGLAQKGIFIAGAQSTNLYEFSVDGVTWSSGAFPAGISGVSNAKMASGSIDDGSTLYEPSYIVVGDTQDYAYSENGITWTTGTWASGTGASHVAYGNNIFMRLCDNDTAVYTSVDGGENWVSRGTVTSGPDTIAFGMGHFFTCYSGTDNFAYSNDDGDTWTTSTLPSSSTWNKIIAGKNKVIVCDGSGNSALSTDNGATWTAIAMPAAIDSITYGNGVFVATSAGTNNRVYYSENGRTWSTYTPTFASSTQLGTIAFGNPGQTGKFIVAGDGTSNLVHDFRIGCTARGRVSVASERIFEVKLWEPGSNYTSAPSITITDPGNINDATFDVRVGKGALAQPSFEARGTNFEAADADVNADLSNGYADFFQTGLFVAVRQLTNRPVPGSNVVFDSLPDTIFKLVNTVSFLGSNDGSYTTFLQLSPNMEIPDAPAHGDGVTIRIRFSQVRLTGHDFLDIGTGNFVDTNYPGVPVNSPNPDNETVTADGGRVFFTATDQDGNFRVGDLFSVEQATGIATLNAEAFNIAGLQELTLGEVTLGGNSAAVSEFSTDPFFTANSDNVVPTQRAIKAYIEAQIGGGGASLNVNSVTAGDIFIATNTITTVSGELINIKARVNFQGGVLGLPLAYNYMLR
jgi:hypothetical protein